MMVRMNRSLALFGFIAATSLVLAGCPSPFSLAELVGIDTGVGQSPDWPYNVRINNYSDEVIVLATEMELIDSYNTTIQPVSGDWPANDELGRLLIDGGDADEIVFTITGQTSGNVVEIRVPTNVNGFVETDNVPSVWDSDIEFINNYNRNFVGAQ